MLPKLDGLQVARLRQAKVDTRIPMLTARDAPPDVVESLDGGADDYLAKPFAFEMLLARLRALARRPPATQRCVSFRTDQADRARVPFVT
jgi:DNA-binding response OmpR family regulator